MADLGFNRRGGTTAGSRAPRALLFFACTLSGWGGLTSGSAPQAPAGLWLRPGGQVSTSAGVRLTAPARWRPATVGQVGVRVRNVNPYSLPPRLSAGLPLPAVVYAVRATTPVWTADAGRFMLRIPVQGSPPSKMLPLRLTQPAVEAVDLPPGATPPEAMWTSDASVRRGPGFVEFPLAGLPGSEELFFAISHLK